jgi:hypothetical protein
MSSVSKHSLIDAALTATTTSDAVGTTQKAKSFIGYLSVTAINAATTITAKIQHSPDKTNWYDLVTFAALVGVVGNERVFVSTAVFPNVRGVATLAGGPPTATAKIELWFDPDK